MQTAISLKIKIVSSVNCVKYILLTELWLKLHLVCIQSEIASPSLCFWAWWYFMVCHREMKVTGKTLERGLKLVLMDCNTHTHTHRVAKPMWCEGPCPILFLSVETQVTKCCKLWHCQPEPFLLSSVFPHESPSFFLMYLFVSPKLPGHQEHTTRFCHNWNMISLPLLWTNHLYIPALEMACLSIWYIWRQHVSLGLWAHLLLFLSIPFFI